MKHFTNKITNEVFGYESLEVAKEFNPDYENLVEMDKETFIHFRDEKPKGGVWTHEGWVIDQSIVNEQKRNELNHLISQKEQELLIAKLRGKDISTILKDLDDLEKELAEYD